MSNTLVLNNNGYECDVNVFNKLTQSKNNSYKSIKMLIAHRKKLIENGKKYGYPDCCIKQFVNMAITNNCPSRIQIKISNNSGYIPCSYCCWKVLSKQINLNDLICNRIYEKPFTSFN